jgi:hypothetical protein
VKAGSSLPNSRKVFDGKCLTERRRRFDKAATDSVIHPLRKTRLPSSEPLQMAFRGLASALLQTGTEASQSAAQRAHRFSTVLVSRAVRGNLNGAHINTQKPVGLAKR